jgi:hypothetical protein
MSVVKSPRAPSLASHAIISFCCLQQANNNSRSHSALHAYEHAADPETHAPLSFFYCARYVGKLISYPPLPLRTRLKVRTGTYRQLFPPEQIINDEALRRLQPPVGQR